VATRPGESAESAFEARFIAPDVARSGWSGQQPLPLRAAGNDAMGSLVARLLLLAQGTPAPGPASGDPAGSNYWVLAPPVIMMIVFFYFLVFLPQKKERQKQDSFHKTLKKNDRVVTIGGIYGVVVNVQREQDEVTIKVDEGTNTKLRLTFNAIARVVTDEAASDKTATD
jgi:preprotein translocase subunit YajC